MTIVHYRMGERLQRLFVQAAGKLPHVPRTWVGGGPRNQVGNETLPKAAGEAVGRINGHEVAIVARWTERNTLDGPQPVATFRSRVDGRYVPRGELLRMCGELCG